MSPVSLPMALRVAAVRASTKNRTAEGALRRSSQIVSLPMALRIAAVRKTPLMILRPKAPRVAVVKCTPRKRHSVPNLYQNILVSPVTDS